MGGGSRPVQSEAEKEGKKNGSGGVRHDVHLMGDPPPVTMTGRGPSWRRVARQEVPGANLLALGGLKATRGQEAFGPVVCRRKRDRPRQERIFGTAGAAEGWDVYRFVNESLLSGSQGLPLDCLRTAHSCVDVDAQRA